MSSDKLTRLNEFDDMLIEGMNSTFPTRSIFQEEGTKLNGKCVHFIN